LEAGRKRLAGDTARTATSVEVKALGAESHDLKEARTEHELPLLHILTDRGTEYCGRAGRHVYQLYVAVNDIHHTKTKAKTPRTNGNCERFHKTILQEFY